LIRYLSAWLKPGVDDPEELAQMLLKVRPLFGGGRQWHLFEIPHGLEAIAEAIRLVGDR
jgi:hypothetical protein